MPYQWIDLEDDEDADALLGGLAIEPGETPVAVTGGGEVLRNPSNAELGGAIGLGSAGSPPPLCDVVVVGAGPAGLAAALTRPRGRRSGRRRSRIRRPGRHLRPDRELSRLSDWGPGPS